MDVPPADLPSWGPDEEGRFSPPGTAVDEEPRPLNGALWLYYLFFRPALFFRHFVVRPVPLLTSVAAWMLGISEAIDEIAWRTTEGFSGRSSSAYPGIVESWESYWSFCIVMGMVAGVLYFVIGGWWYRLRLDLAGADHPDKGLARRVYLFASQVYAVPAVMYTIWETSHYPNPTAAADGEDALALIVILFLFWSVYTSYRGVRTAFEVRRWGARMWFLILPGTFYLVLIGGGCAWSQAREGFFDRSPAVDKPVSLNRAAFTLRYPGNWSVDTEDEDSDPDHNFGIEPMWPIWVDAGIYVTIYDSRIDSLAEIDATVAGLVEQPEVLSKTPIQRWGRYEGVGYELSLEREGSHCRVVVFAATAEDAGFEIMEHCDVDDWETMEPGFQLIRESFLLKRRR